MKQLNDLIALIDGMDTDKKVAAINEVKAALQSVSPFKYEPVDCVQWVKEELVIANDYNPNTVAPPEMELLHTSIQEDGYTQPIVVYQHDGIYEVVDGFHRNRVGKEYPGTTRPIVLPLLFVTIGREANTVLRPCPIL